jgi:hypothetical protein
MFSCLLRLEIIAENLTGRSCILKIENIRPRNKAFSIEIITRLESKRQKLCLDREILCLSVILLVTLDTVPTYLAMLLLTKQSLSQK